MQQPYLSEITEQNYDTQDKRAVILIQCRYDSKRLPGKILKELKPNLTCLEYLIQRLSKVNYDIIVATTDRTEDIPIIIAVSELKVTKKYPHLLGFYLDDLNNIAERLYNASEGYGYIIRITGDDILVDYQIIEKMLEYTIYNELDYTYPHDLIRGCDLDIFKRDALYEAMQLYNTTNFESIEFLFKNEKFNTKIFKVLPSHKNPDISLTLDTENDWELIKIVFDKLYKIYPFFTTFDILELFSRNTHLNKINKTPRISVYTVFKDYKIEWLNQAVRSLKNQTFQDFEYIFIDYGSNALQKINTVINDENIRTFIIPKNKEYTFIQAIEFAVSKAKGKYIIRLDADDVFKPNILERMYTFISRNHKYSSVVANFDGINAEGTTITKNVNGDIAKISTCALIEKNKYQYVKFLKDQEFRDGTSWFKTFKKYNFLIGYILESLFMYRLHTNSLTHGRNRNKKIKEQDKKILRDHKNF